MVDLENSIPNTDEAHSEEPAIFDTKLKKSTTDYTLIAIKELQEQISGLQDLFVRRLMDDKQKAGLIQTLQDGANFAFIEPFLSDIILLLDRLEKAEDDFSQSIKDELVDILERRGVKQIEVTDTFNPALNKAVKVIEAPDIDLIYVKRIIRNGYTFLGKVIRATEVEVAKPMKTNP
ncbi:nucleotide exchange factor GrpE [Candidatus Saccharibacteria bacterium]|nr:nucleotide exchange factor GrpE [Candidatus Saccharibacteria bacterium]